MKSYDETVNSVFKRIDDYKIAQKRKRKIIIRTVTPICCVSLVVLLGIGLWQSDIFNKPPATLNDSIIIGEQDYFDDRGGSKLGIGNWYGEGQEEAPSGVAEATSSDEASSDNSSAKLLCYINQIESMETFDIGGPHPMSEHYAESWDNEKMTAYLGIDFSELDELYKLDSYNHGAWYKKADNTLVSDYANFAYSNEKNSFQISASKTEMPKECIISTKNDDVRETGIGTSNGSVKVKFYGTVGTDAKEKPEIQGRMIAEFEHKGVFFRVKANDISAFNFYKFVSLIVNG